MGIDRHGREEGEDPPVPSRNRFHRTQERPHGQDDEEEGERIRARIAGVFEQEGAGREHGTRSPRRGRRDQATSTRMERHHRGRGGKQRQRTQRDLARAEHSHPYERDDVVERCAPISSRRAEHVEQVVEAVAADGPRRRLVVPEARPTEVPGTRDGYGQDEREDPEPLRNRPRSRRRRAVVGDGPDRRAVAQRTRARSIIAGVGHARATTSTAPPSRSGRRTGGRSPCGSFRRRVGASSPGLPRYGTHASPPRSTARKPGTEAVGGRPRSRPRRAWLGARTTGSVIRWPVSDAHQPRVEDHPEASGRYRRDRCSPTGASRRRSRRRSSRMGAKSARSRWGRIDRRRRSSRCSRPRARRRADTRGEAPHPVLG